MSYPNSQNPNQIYGNNNVQPQGYHGYQQPQPQQLETQENGKLVGQVGGFIFAIVMVLIQFETAIIQQFDIREYLKQAEFLGIDYLVLIIKIACFFKVCILCDIFIHAMVYPRTKQGLRFGFYAGITLLICSVKFYYAGLSYYFIRDAIKILISEAILFGFIWSVFFEEDSKNALTRVFKPWVLADNEEKKMFDNQSNI